MTPFMLQAALAEELKQLFEGKQWKKPMDEGGQLAPMAIFKQNVPMGQYGEDEASYFPYLLVGITDWKQESLLEPVVCTLVILVGIFDDDVARQGHQDLLNILQDIELFLKQKGILQGKYRLDYPVKGLISEEDTYPFFFGALETSWQLMNIYGNKGEEENI